MVNRIEPVFSSIEIDFIVTVSKLSAWTEEFKGAQISTADAGTAGDTVAIIRSEQMSIFRISAIYPVLELLAYDWLIPNA